MMQGRGPNVGIIGAPGAGKTHWALAALGGAWPEVTGARSRVIYVDPAGTVLAFSHFTREPEAVSRLAPTSRTPFACVVRLDHLPRSEREAAVDDCAALASRLKRVTLVVDEFGLTVEPRRLGEHLEHAIRAGRHVGVSVWPVSQRAVDFGPDLRSCLDVMVIMRQDEANDVKALNSWSAHAQEGGASARKLGDVARDLPDRSCIVLRRGRWRVYTGR